VREGLRGGYGGPVWTEDPGSGGEIRQVRAGDIDPAIIYGEESEALGINAIAAHSNDYILPIYIEGAITRIEFAAKLGVEKVDMERPFYGEERLLEDKEFTLTETQLARHQRLNEMLEISRERMAKIGKLRDEMGWNDLNEKMDKICGQQCDIAARILKTNSAAPSDLTIKFAINRRYDDNWATDSIMRDMRRLMKQPSLLAQALEQAA
jgi:hypothetical protein